MDLYIIHARSNLWMLAGFNMAWQERRFDALSWRFNEVFNLTAIEMSVNCVDSHVEAYFSNPS